MTDGFHRPDRPVVSLTTKTDGPGDAGTIIISGS
jgi:hypothetical protein